MRTPFLLWPALFSVWNESQITITSPQSLVRSKPVHFRNVTQLYVYCCSLWCLSPPQPSLLFHLFFPLRKINKSIENTFQYCPLHFAVAPRPYPTLAHTLPYLQWARSWFRRPKHTHLGAKDNSCPATLCAAWHLGKPLQYIQYRSWPKWKRITQTKGCLKGYLHTAWNNMDAESVQEHLDNLQQRYYFKEPY